MKQLINKLFKKYEKAMVAIEKEEWAETGTSENRLKFARQLQLERNQLILDGKLDSSAPLTRNGVTVY